MGALPRFRVHRSWDCFGRAKGREEGGAKRKHTPLRWEPSVPEEASRKRPRSDKEHRSHRDRDSREHRSRDRFAAAAHKPRLAANRNV